MYVQTHITSTLKVFTMHFSSRVYSLRVRHNHFSKMKKKNQHAFSLLDGTEGTASCMSWSLEWRGLGGL